MLGSGTELDPYIIQDVDDLQDMSLDINAFYELGSDIDASDTENWNWDGSKYLGFEPVCPGTQFTMIRRPISDLSATGTWVAEPDDGVLWDKISDAIPDDGTYIFSDVLNSTAIFGITPFTIPSNATQIQVGIKGRKRKSTLGTTSYVSKAIFYIDGVSYEQTFQPHDTTAWNNGYTWMFTENFATGDPWTPDEVNGVGADSLEGIGIKLDLSQNIFLSDLYIEVTYYLPLQGSFDGKNYTISNLYINRPDEDAAMIGYCSDYIIKNVNFTNADVTGITAVIAIVEAGSTIYIDNVNVHGKLTGSVQVNGILAYTTYGATSMNVLNCNVDIEAEVSSVSTFYFGGLAGYLFGTITNCHTNFIATCSGCMRSAAGFVQDVGDYAVFTNCSSKGTLTINENIDTTWTGSYGGFACSGYWAKYINCRADVDVEAVITDTPSHNNGFGGFITYTHTDDEFYECYSKGKISVTTNGSTKGVGIGGFIEFTCSEEILEDCFSCVDIDVKNYGNARGIYIGGFVGFSCDDEKYTRCFSVGTINLEDHGTYQYYSEIGGFAGSIYFREEYKQCFSAGKISILEQEASTGGFVGEFWNNSGYLQDVYSVVNPVKLDSTDFWCAGFAGFLRTSTTSPGYIMNTYSMGLIDTDANSGGYGASDGVSVPSITASFWDIQTSGKTLSVGGEGKETLWMKTRSKFVAEGWDFDTIWHISRHYNNGYPCFIWFRDRVEADYYDTDVMDKFKDEDVISEDKYNEIVHGIPLPEEIPESGSGSTAVPVYISGLHILDILD